MLNLKSLWMYCTNTSKPEHMNVNKGSKNFAWSSSMEISTSKGLVNLTFAYPGILTVSIYDGCLGIAAVMACWVEQQRPGKEVKHFLDCMRAWAACVCGARTKWSFVWRLPALSHSFLLPFFLFLSLYFFFFSLFFFYIFFYISLLFFFFFTSFFMQARTEIFLKQEYSFGWLELAAWRYAISPTLVLLCESQVCNVEVLFWVCSHSKEHQSVQLMQSFMFSGIICPLFFLIVTWNG